MNDLYGTYSRSAQGVAPIFKERMKWLSRINRLITLLKEQYQDAASKVVLFKGRLLVGRKFIVDASGATSHPSNMAFYSPGPFVPFLPSKHFPAKVYLEVTISFHPNCSENILILARKIDTIESRWKAYAIVCIKQGPSLEFVPTPDCVSWVDAIYSVCVVASAIRVLEELAEVIEVKSSAHSVPTWKTPGGIWSACSACSI